MQKFIIPFVILLFFSNQIFSQEEKKIICGNELLDKITINDKEYLQLEEKFNVQVKQFGKSIKNTTTDLARYYTNGPDYIIPVVIHIVHNGEPLGQGTNISYAQIQSQLDALNAALSNYDVAANYIQPGVNLQYDNPLRRGIHGVDTKIRFCLARNMPVISPNGYQITGETGVVRYNNSQLSAHDMSVSSQNSLMGLTNPNGVLSPQNYFNIWVVSSINGATPGVEGYAPIPIDLPYALGFSIRGVVIRSDVFGDNSVNNNNFILQPQLNPSTGGGNNGLNFSQGKVLVHEIGHAFGLYHTFHTYTQTTSSPCDLTGGDLLSDTPPSDISNLTTFTGVGTRNTCHTDSPDVNDMVENFMYYSTDNIYNTFTNDQKIRMQATLSLVYPNLTSEQNVLDTGVVGPGSCFDSVLTAFYTKPSNICTNSATNFSGMQIGNAATSWQWSVVPNSGVIISNAMVSNPTITFQSSGNYSVTLTVTDTTGMTDTATNQVYVSACNLDPCQIANSHLILGNGTHIDFSSGFAVAKTDAYLTATPTRINSFEANFTQSDANGNLVFYTDGNWVWNAQHQIINQNNPIGGNDSLHQMIGVPFPGHPNQYVLLILPSAEEVVVGTGSFRYCIVDFSGTIPNVSNSVTILVSSPLYANRLGEGITVIPHCNGRDYWFFIAQANGGVSSYIKTFLLNNSGVKYINQTQVNSQNGLLVGLNSAKMFLKTNKQGTKILGNFSEVITVIDFDAATGTMSNTKLLNVTIDQNDAVFSPNGQKIYVRNGTTIGIWDVSGSSITPINSNFITGTFYPSFTMFLAPNDEIYFTDSGDHNLCLGTTIYNSLGVIQNPDAVSPVVQNSFINLNAVNQFCFSNGTPMQGMRYAAPNMINACKPLLQDFSFNLAKTSCDTVALYLQGCYNQYNVSINWGDGSTSTTGLFSTLSLGPTFHSYQNNGNYTVTVTLSIDGQLDTNGDGIIDTNVTSLPAQMSQVIINSSSTASIAGPVNVCPNSTPIQYVFNNGTTGTYTWTISGVGNTIIGAYTGVGINSVSALWQNNGTLTVTYQEGGCSVTKSINVSILTNNQIQTGTITGLNVPCALNPTTYSVTPIANATSYTWIVPPGATIVSGQGTSSIIVNFANSSLGNITVTASNACSVGTTSSLAIEAIKQGVPSQISTINGPSATCLNTLVVNYSLAFTGTVPSYTNYNWVVTGGTILSGQGTSSIQVNFNSIGIKTISVTPYNACGNGLSTTKTVSVSTTPNLTVKGATTICQGATTALYAYSSSGLGTYLWSNGATSSSILVSPLSTTNYSVTLTDQNGCSVTANKTVTVISPPIVSVSGNTTICLGSSTTLTASGGGTYLWSNGATSASITVSPTVTSTYSVTVTNSSGCIASKDITVVVNNIQKPEISAYYTSPPSPYTNPMIPVCSGKEQPIQLYLANNPPGIVYNYTWTVPSGVLINGSNQSSYFSGSTPNVHFTFTNPPDPGYINTPNSYGNVSWFEVTKSNGMCSVTKRFYVLITPRNFFINNVNTNFTFSWTHSSTYANTRTLSFIDLLSSNPIPSTQVTVFPNNTGNQQVNYTNIFPFAGSYLFKWMLDYGSKGCECGLNKYIVSIPPNYNKVSDLNQIFIYPNPAKTSITIDGIEQGNAIEIYDMQGKLLFAKDAENTNEVIDVSQFADGIYLAKITTVNQKVKIVKFIIEN